MVDKIKIEKYNEAFIKIQCDRGIFQEISDHFTFFVPGYTFNPKFKMKLWDGKIRLLNSQTGLLYYGLFQNLCEFAKSRKYEIDASDDIFSSNEFSLIEARQYIESLKLARKGKPLIPYEYQEEAFLHSIRQKRIILLSSVSSGKSLVAYLIVRYLISQGKKGLLIVPSTHLVKQMYTDFEEYSGLNGWDIQANTHTIYSGKEKKLISPLTISTWQSLYTQSEELFSEIDFIIGDEAHGYKANSLISIMKDKLHHCEYRIGLTGTLDETKVHKLVLEGLFGPVKTIITMKELIDSNRAAKLGIKCLILNYEDSIRKELYNNTYEEEFTFICSYPERNKFIKNLAFSLDGNTLILFRRKELHGKILAEMITKDIIKFKGRNIFYLDGDTSLDDREKIRAQIEKEKNAIIIASYGIYRQGVNIENLNNLIFGSPYKGKIINLQSIGRTLRGTNAKESTIFDIVDNLKYKNKSNFTLTHFFERVKIYNTENLPFKTYNIDLFKKKE